MSDCSLIYFLVKAGCFKIGDCTVQTLRHYSNTQSILIPLVGCSPYEYWYTPSNDQFCLFFNLSIDEIYHPLFFAVVGM